MRNRLLSALCLSAALAALSPLDGPAFAKGLPPANSAWPHSISDLPADPAVRFGTLPNGMRYAILKNTTPPGEVSFRFRFAVGSIQETPDEQGIAHFLEHMAFRGSTHVPEGEVFKRMERLGAALGADTNAFTNQTETVYKFDVPNADAKTINTAFDLLRETASELSIKQDLVDTERKVVLSEERLGDAPNRRAYKEQNSFLFKGQPVGDHLTIGDVSVLQKVSAKEIRAFYERWYRPERATLVVTGDIDPAAIEGQIKARFSNWKGRGKAGVDPVLGPPQTRSFESQSHIEAGTQSGASVVWNKPYRDGADDRTLEIDDTIRQIALSAFNQRLQDMTHTPNPPFVGAGAANRDIARSAQATYLGVTTASPDKIKTALEESAKVVRAATEIGFSQDELDRQIAVFRRQFDAAAAGADKRPTPHLADELTLSVDAGDVFMHPRDQQKLVEEVLHSVTLDQVNQAARQAFSGSGPLLFVTAAEPVDGADRAFSDALAKAPEASQTAKAESWPYTHFGTPGTVVSRSSADDLGVTLITFENGVRLTVKPTNFREDQILVAISLGNGRAGISPAAPPSMWTINAGGFLDGGLGRASVVDINRELASRSVQSYFQGNDRSFQLGGATRPQDLDAELQLLTAYIADPGWRAEGFEEARSKLRTVLPQMENTASSMFQRDAEGLLHGGDNRWKFPDAAVIDAATPDMMKSLIDGALTGKPIEVTVVGNVTVDQAIAAVASTLGSLPARHDAMAIPPANLAVKLPAGNVTPVRLSHHGRKDESLAFVAWPAPDALGDWREIKDLQVLRAILQQRLFDDFRGKIGGTYSPGVGLLNSRQFPDFGYFSAQVETPPEKIAIFNETLTKILADLKANPVGEDEFERARKPVIETIRKSQQTNEYWLNMLAKAQSDDRQLDVIRAAIPGLEAVTPVSVQQTAQKWLKDENAWHLEILPEGAE